MNMSREGSRAARRASALAGHITTSVEGQTTLPPCCRNTKQQRAFNHLCLGQTRGTNIERGDGEVASASQGSKAPREVRESPLPTSKDAMARQRPVWTRKQRG